MSKLLTDRDMGRRQADLAIVRQYLDTAIARTLDPVIKNWLFNERDEITGHIVELRRILFDKCYGTSDPTADSADVSGEGQGDQ